MAKKLKSRRLTVLLLKESVMSSKKALREPEALHQVKVKDDAGFKGQFWYAEPRSKKPAWHDLIAPALEQIPRSLSGTSLSALLFVETANRRFAVTFGYGRNLLKPDSYELGFGLKVALNRIDPRQIRSMDLRAYEELAMSTRKQASRSADLTPFGLDISRDLLRAVTGEPTDQGFAKRVSGADAVTVNVQIDIRDIGNKCSALLDAFGDDAYKTHFEWIDHLHEVRDSTRIAQLNGELLQTIYQRQTEKLHLAAPDPLEWQDVDVFRISGTRLHEYDDLDIDEYLNTLGEVRVKELTIEKLKSSRISVRYSGNETFQAKWPLFSCLVWETKIGGLLYALLEGKWFQIEENFARRVSKYVSEIPQSSVLPDARHAEKETDYNERVAEENSEVFVSLDQKLVKPQDSVTRIEFCDLLSTEKCFVHVKRRSRSSTLSHLFAQGTVAARAFLADPKVRSEVREHLASNWHGLIPDEASRPIPGDYEVIYAVITSTGTKAGNLPFFSQLNLMQHAKLLRELGYRVAFAPVKERNAEQQ